MRHGSKWQPTKFVTDRGRLIGSRKKAHLGVASRLFADRTAQYFYRYARDHCRGDLIDLGCGRVPLYGIYKEQVRSTTCVDWPNSLHGNIHLDVACDISKPLPFSDSSFDTVILSDVLEHIPAPEALWAELRRITRQDGKVLLSVPFFYWLHETPYDFYRYTEWALRRFAEKAGFAIVILEAMGGSPEVFADILAKHFQHIPVIGHAAAATTQVLASSLTSTSIGRRFSQKTSKVYPYGYFLIASRSHDVPV